MEELQSTDILDREILEDARKKAVRIFKTADDTVAAKSAEWEAKTAQAVDSIIKKYNEQKTLAADKIMARLPVDKLRLKVERIEKALNEAVEDWYKNTDRKLILKLLSDELSERTALCNEDFYSNPTTVYHCGIEGSEAMDLLSNIKGHYKLIKDSSSPYPRLILETENVRIIASIQNLIDNLLAEKREELVEALVGREFLEGNN